MRVLCGDDFDVSSLAPLLRWLDQVLVKFVEKLSEHCALIVFEEWQLLLNY